MKNPSGMKGLPSTSVWPSSVMDTSPFFGLYSGAAARRSVLSPAFAPVTASCIATSNRTGPEKSSLPKSTVNVPSSGVTVRDASARPADVDSESRYSALCPSGTNGPRKPEWRRMRPVSVKILSCVGQTLARYHSGASSRIATLS